MLQINELKTENVDLEDKVQQLNEHHSTTEKDHASNLNKLEEALEEAATVKEELQVYY